MKKAVIVSGLVIGLAIFGSIGKVMADSQIVEGVKKIVTAPIEIPKNIIENADEHGPGALVTGTVEGTVEGVGQIGDGTEDVVTAPVNEDFDKDEGMQ